MTGRVFPRQFDNHYRGSVLAIWLLVLLAAVKVLQGANVVARSRRVLETVDRVPVTSFPADAASHLVFFNWTFLAIAAVGFVLSVAARKT